MTIDRQAFPFWIHHRYGLVWINEARRLCHVVWVFGSLFFRFLCVHWERDSGVCVFQSMPFVMVALATADILLVPLYIYPLINARIIKDVDLCVKFLLARALEVQSRRD